MSNNIKKNGPIINKESLSKEDTLFYTLKHGHPPKYRIEKIPYIDENNGESKLKYKLTNIPDEGNDAE